MDRLSKIALSAWFILSLVQAIFTELFHDEAYYWVFSHYLDWGFKDHPPVTALLVAAGSNLLPGEIGVRLFMVILSTLTAYLTWRITKPGDPHLFWSLFFAMPVMVVFGFLAVPDIPLLFGCVVFFFFWRQYLEADHWSTVIALVITLTFLAYTKYHGALVFLLALAPHLRLLKRPSFWIIITATSILILPHLWWQYEHDWLSFRYHLVDRAGDKWEFRFVLEYLGSQLGIWGPFTGILLWIGLFRRRVQSDIEKSLRFVGIGFLLFFFYQSWTQPTEANWTGPVFLPLVYLGYHDLQFRAQTKTWAIRLALASLGMILIARIFLVWDFIGMKKAQEFHHWEEWSQLISNVAGPLPVVFENRYQRPSKYLFYSNNSAFCQTTEMDAGTQFDLLYELEENVQGKSVCLVYENPYPGSWQDTIVESSPIGRRIGFRWADDFRSYNRIWCQLDTSLRTFPTGHLIDLPITMTNPTDQVISWDTIGHRRVTFEYLFIHDNQIKQEGIALTAWPTTSLQPGETVHTKIQVKTPFDPAEYRFRMAWRVHDLYRGKNSGFYMVDISEK